MKDNIKFLLNTINKLIYFVFVCISIWFIYKVLKMNIIPNKYLLIGLPIYGVITIVLGVFVFVKNSILKVISNIISIVIIALIFTVNNYLVHTDKFMDNIKEKDYVFKSYYVIALEKNKYKDIPDFKSLGIYESDEDYNEALKQITDKNSIKINTYSNFDEAKTKLLEEEEEAVLISNADYGIMTDVDGSLEEKIAIVATINIKKENEVVSVDINVTEKPFNILITGIDIAGDISTVSRSDVNMIVTVNPNTHELLLTSIPRDYYVTLADIGAKDKLTHSGLYGARNTAQTLANLFDIDIKYYVRVNFSTVMQVVDLIGGVDIDSDKSFRAHTNKSCYINQGMNHLDGACALAYARERYTYQAGDLHRVLNQQDVLIAILNKTMTSKEMLNNYFDILNVLSNSFQTNIQKEKIYELIKLQLNYMKAWDIDRYSVNGFNDFQYTYSYSGGKLYVMHPNMETVKEAKIKIDTLLNK